MTTWAMTSQDISENLISNTTNIHRNLQSSAGKRGNIGNSISTTGITVTGLSHQQISVTTTADKWGAWNDQLKITIPINYVISTILLHH